MAYWHYSFALGQKDRYKKKKKHAGLLKDNIKSNTLFVAKLHKNGYDVSIDDLDIERNHKIWGRAAGFMHCVAN